MKEEENHRETGFIESATNLVIAALVLQNLMQAMRLSGITENISLKNNRLCLAFHEIIPVYLGFTESNKSDHR